MALNENSPAPSPPPTIQGLRWLLIVLFSLDSLARGTLSLALLFGRLQPSPERLSYLADLSPAGLKIAALAGLLWASATGWITVGLLRWRPYARLFALSYYGLGLLLVAFLAFQNRLSLGGGLASGLVAVLAAGLLHPATRRHFSSQARHTH